MAFRLDTLARFRRLAVIASHMVVFAGALWAAFMLRFEFALPELYADMMVQTLPIAVGVKLITFMVFRQYSGWWRYVTLPDLVGMGRAATASTIAFASIIYLLNLRAYPRTVFIMDLVLTVGGLSFLRIGVRLLRESVGSRDTGDGPVLRTLIAGTGPTAESLIRETVRQSSLNMRVLGLLSDDPAMIGTRVGGTPIVGLVNEIPRLVSQLGVEQIVIAVETKHGDVVREIVRHCQSADVRHRVLPPTSALLEGSVSISRIRDVSLQDLLGRAPVRLETHTIAELVNGETVLVTGAGGSIGSELCRQVASFGPARLVLLEQAENPLFALERELLLSAPEVRLEPIIADIYDGARLAQIVQELRPAIVLHAAAHKHVPLMERNPTEAVKNNIIGTLNLIRAAQAAEVGRVVLISTDKAVNPTSVMGATKRYAEMLMQALSSETPTRLAAVRFGNVLGSNGSVIPIFKSQIERGGPVTVTHPEMVRYFMTIPEATQLVLQAATYAQDADVFVLDMQEPVKIVDVARDLIRLSGLEPERDIPIVFTGIRPGEKLFEELATDTETTSPTEHERIFRCRMERPAAGNVLAAVERLHDFAREGLAPVEMRRAIFDLLKVLEERATPEGTSADAEGIANTDA